MSIIHLKEYPNSQMFLSNKNWIKTNYYEICCNSELWGCAYLISIEKEITNDKNEAIIYLLKRFVIERESWDIVLQENINASEFINFVLSDYIFKEKSIDITIPEFLENFKEITNGIFNSENVQITKNGKILEDKNLINLKELKVVTSFCNEWNVRQFFVETSLNWLLFSWSTSV